MRRAMSIWGFSGLVAQALGSEFYGLGFIRALGFQSLGFSRVCRWEL